MAWGLVVPGFRCVVGIRAIRNFGLNTSFKPWGCCDYGVVSCYRVDVVLCEALQLGGLRVSGGKRGVWGWRVSEVHL